MVEGKARGKAAKARPRAKTKKAKRPGAGRPAFEVTAEQRERVEILIGGGMTVEEIASAMSMAVNTLKKHFGNELRLGRSKKRSEILEAMYNSAKGGNVSAQKAFIALNALADADDAALNPPTEQPTPSKARGPKLGKKEQAAEDAVDAGVGTEWGSDLDVESPPNVAKH